MPYHTISQSDDSVRRVADTLSCTLKLPIDVSQQKVPKFCALPNSWWLGDMPTSKWWQDCQQWEPVLWVEGRHCSMCGLVPAAGTIWGLTRMVRRDGLTSAFPFLLLPAALSNYKNSTTLRTASTPSRP